MNTIILNISKQSRKKIAALTLLALLLSSPGLSFARSVTSSTDTTGQTCTVVTLTSDNVTQTAGYTQTNPSATPLNPTLYAHALSAATSTAQIAPSWIDPSVNTNFNTSSSTWISSAATGPGETGNTEGSSTMDQWRLFHDQFTVPAGATVTAADIWYTADNAAALYQNGTFLDRTEGTSSDDVFGAIPTAMPQVFANVFHDTLTPTTGVNTIDFVTRNWAVGSTTSTTNPTGLLYKAVIRYCVPPVVVAPTTGNLTVMNMVSGGTATSADFQIHVTKDGLDIVGSPAVGSTTGTMYSGIATGTYAVSRTAGVPANYSTAFSGDCDTLGNVSVLASTTKTCMLTNTFTGTTTATSTGTGSLTIMTVVNGGTATASAFQVHIKRAGVEISGSPFAAISSGFTLSSLTPDTYVVSQGMTSGTSSDYSTAQSGDCDTLGNVRVVASTTKTCTFTNTFIGTTTPTFLKVHILKYLDGSMATATSASGYLFPMTATWQTPNLNAGSSASGTFVLGNNFGQAANLYGADTALMQSPANYSTAEVTDGASKVLPASAACASGMYRLKGYTTSATSFADAATQTMTTTAPNFTGLAADRYVIVWNETCGNVLPPPPPPVSGTPQAQKQSVLDSLVALQSTMTNDRSSWWYDGDHHDKHGDRRGGKSLLGDAIENVRASLSPALWTDPSHVSDTNGDTVFDREQDAVVDLMRMMKIKGDNAMDTTLQGFIDRLVAADHALASTAITDAVNAQGKLQNITKASDRLAKGDTALQNSKTLRAMWRYQSAWGFAVTAH